MAVLYTNNASATLAANISSSVTAIAVTSTQGALFPSPSGGDFFYATLVNAANSREIVKVTARSSDAMTVVRAQEGTTAAAWLAGDKFELRVTAAGLANKLDKDTGGSIGGSIAITGDVTATGNGKVIGLSVDSAPGAARPLFFKSSGLTRWQVLADGAAEGGSNSGSNFGIYRYTDAGAFADIAISIDRASGQVSVGQPFNANAGVVGNLSGNITSTGSNVLGSLAVSGGTNFVGDAVFNSSVPPSSIYSVGFRGAPINEQDTSYVMQLSDAGRMLRASITNAINWTIPLSTFPAGTVIMLRNWAGSSQSVTINRTSGVALYGSGTTTDKNWVLAPGGMASITQEVPNFWVIAGTGLS